MGKIEELEKLDKAIKDAEASLKSIQANIEKIANEIGTLTVRKMELQQNINFHKKEDTISIAHEYKKAKDELSKVIARLILISSDQNKAVSACKDTEKVLDKFRYDHAKLLRTSENNVLRVIFGGRRGKK